MLWQWRWAFSCQTHQRCSRWWRHIYLNPALSEVCSKYWLLLIMSDKNHENPAKLRYCCPVMFSQKRCFSFLKLISWDCFPNWLMFFAVSCNVRFSVFLFAGQNKLSLSSRSPHVDASLLKNVALPSDSPVAAIRRKRPPVPSIAAPKRKPVNVPGSLSAGKEEYVEFIAARETVLEISCDPI